MSAGINRWRYEISTQDEGEVHFIYRTPSSLASLEDLEAWMALVLRKIRREVEAALPAPPETP